MAAEVFVGALLSAVLDPLIEKFASSVRNFFSHDQSVEKLVENLNKALLSANKLLNDAENKQVTNSDIKNWVDTLNGILSEAEHVLDKINTEALQHGNPVDKINTEALQPGIKRMFENLTKSVSSSFNAFDRAIKHEIVNITETLDSHLKDKDSLGLREGVESKRLLKRCYAPLIVNSSDVHGRDDDIKAIMESLFSKIDDDKISVISIVGMGGVGKTTLARLVYGDNSVNDHFELRAWVTVSDDFDVFKLAKQALEGFTEKDSKVKGEESLMRELKKILCGKKFLLVLDDVWNEDYALWNKLKSCFQFGAEESKIIVTTRNETIGSKMGSVPSHRLNTMSDRDCWQLFTKHAFHNIEPDVRRDLEENGQAIVKKCKGLPLAVMSLAGLLCSVSDPKEWKAVLQSDVWELNKNGNNEILPSLWLSYSYLPSQFKRCFSYCSFFPKDHEYNQNEIILLWMAEGLLQGENMEDDGEKCFKTLISRSLFLRSAQNESSVVMHDLVHDLATFVSGKDFCIRLNDGDSGLRNLTNKTRHLLCSKKLPQPKDFEGLSDENSLCGFIALLRLPRSIIYEDNADALLKKLQRLRALCLSRSSIIELAESIGKLKHLRYLDLSCTYIERLPDAVCSLYNLQTLLLNGCGSLTELPANMGRLLNLRHLDLRDTPSLERMPLSNWNLKGLRTLTKLVLNDEHSGSKIKELKELSDGSFEIVGLENVVNPKDVLEAEFEKKSGITEITLTWSARRSNFEKDREVLDAFKPHGSLKNLKIKEYGGTELSDWVGDGSLTNMTEVSLLWCRRCQLPPFERLHSLKELNIYGFLSVKTIHWKAGSFSKLEYLSINGMDELQSWSLESVAFRCLKLLILSSCRQMEVLSCGQMNTTFPSLVKLKIDKCPKLEITGLPLPSGLENLGIEYDCEKFMAQRMQWGLVTTSLKWLTIQGCKGLIDAFPEEGLLPTTLQTLWISHTPNMKALNGKAFQHLTSLTYLSIRGCPKLECLPEQGLPASLTYLSIDACPKLECLPEQGLPASLTYLSIEACPKLECLPEQGLPASLTRLSIKICPKLECLPEQGLPASLTDLSIYDCPKLECLPEQGLPASLTYLSIDACPKLECLPEQGLPASLTYLSIEACPKLECLPEQGLPASLTDLSIYDCPKLECLPEQGLPASLTDLSIYDCPKLECLPEQGLPASLTRLDVVRCPQLEARLQRETGQDWHKISHIPEITVNRKEI